MTEDKNKNPQITLQKESQQENNLFQANLKELGSFNTLFEDEEKLILNKELFNQFLLFQKMMSVNKNENTDNQSNTYINNLYNKIKLNYHNLINSNEKSGNYNEITNTSQELIHNSLGKQQACNQSKKNEIDKENVDDEGLKISKEFEFSTNYERNVINNNNLDDQGIDVLVPDQKNSCLNNSNDNTSSEKTHFRNFKVLSVRKQNYSKLNSKDKDVNSKVIRPEFTSNSKSLNNPDEIKTSNINNNQIILASDDNNLKTKSIAYDEIPIKQFKRNLNNNNDEDKNVNSNCRDNPMVTSELNVINKQNSVKNSISELNFNALEINTNNNKQQHSSKNTFNPLKNNLAKSISDPQENLSKLKEGALIINNNNKSDIRNNPQKNSDSVNYSSNANENKKSSGKNLTFDEIPIRPCKDNFERLLEEEIKNNENHYTNNEAIINQDKDGEKILQKRSIKTQYKPKNKKTINISIPKRNEVKVYKYYADNFKNNKVDLMQDSKNKIKSNSKNKSQSVEKKEGSLDSRKRNPKAAKKPVTINNSSDINPRKKQINNINKKNTSRVGGLKNNMEVNGEIFFNNNQTNFHINKNSLFYNKNSNSNKGNFKDDLEVKYKATDLNQKISKSQGILVTTKFLGDKQLRQSNSSENMRIKKNVFNNNSSSQEVFEIDEDIEIGEINTIDKKIIVNERIPDNHKIFSSGIKNASKSKICQYQNKDFSERAAFLNSNNKSINNNPQCFLPNNPSESIIKDHNNDQNIIDNNELDNNNNNKNNNSYIPSQAELLKLKESLKKEIEIYHLKQTQLNLLIIKNKETSRKLEEEKISSSNQLKNEMLEFEKYKANEIRQLKMLKNSILSNNANRNNFKVTSKKDIDEVNNLKAEILRVQEELKLKESNNKLLIESLKKQLNDAKFTIDKLTIQGNNSNTITTNKFKSILSNADYNNNSKDHNEDSAYKKINNNINYLKNERNTGIINNNINNDSNSKFTKFNEKRSQSNAKNTKNENNSLSMSKEVYSSNNTLKNKNFPFSKNNKDERIEIPSEKIYKDENRKFNPAINNTENVDDETTKRQENNPEERIENFIKDDIKMDSGHGINDIDNNNYNHHLNEFINELKGKYAVNNNNYKSNKYGHIKSKVGYDLMKHNQFNKNLSNNKSNSNSNINVVKNKSSNKLQCNNDEISNKQTASKIKPFNKKSENINNNINTNLNFPEVEYQIPNNNTNNTDSNNSIINEFKNNKNYKDLKIDINEKSKNDFKLSKQQQDNNESSIGFAIHQNNNNNNNQIQSSSKSNSAKLKLNYEEELKSFSLNLPEQYKHNNTILRQEKLSDGKILNFYENNIREVIFSSGVQKEIHTDGYQIVKFPNQDIKQLFPDGRMIYFFNDSNIVQTSIPLLKLQVFKFSNGQIERHFENGDKQILYPNGTIKIVNNEGEEEIFKS